MRLFTDDDIKRVGLEILDEFHKFCIENGLKYSLAYGTLLGAIRHKGYIPWDDDIDVIMPRSDYTKFINSFDTKNYGVMSCWTNPKYYLPWAKVYDKRTIKIEDVYEPKGFEIGFNIDVFPVDEIDDLEKLHKVKKRYRSAIKKLGYSEMKIQKVSSVKIFLKNIIAHIYHGSGNKYSKIIDESLEKESKGKQFNLYAHFDIFLIDKDCIFHKDTFSNLQNVEFENRIYLATAYFDYCLTACYGDYMTPPPESERVTHHSFKAYFK